MLCYVIRRSRRRASPRRRTGGHARRTQTGARTDDPTRASDAPSPRRLLSFTDEYAIPTAIAVLEANIRALESLQEVIHLTNRGLDATESTRAGSRRARDVSQEAVTRLERALTDIQVALEEGALPENPEARKLLTEARDLRTEIDDRLAESRGTTRPAERRASSQPIVIPVEPDDEDRAADEQAAHELEDALAEEEIEAELETIREELDKVDDEDDET
ncbi:DUF7547 family protein [Haladaptatus sp. GCM10025893]|uniref:DUF7547 family protein n=1 Tax=Haladaptatus sp. GCM10025893 TaxID=3252659 RepID=UPI00360B684D